MKYTNRITSIKATRPKRRAEDIPLYDENVGSVCEIVSCCLNGNTHLDTHRNATLRSDNIEKSSRAAPKFDDSFSLYLL